METENRRRAPDAIDVYQGSSDAMSAQAEDEELSEMAESEGGERRLADILSEREQRNIGNAINRRNPWEY